MQSHKGLLLVSHFHPSCCRLVIFQSCCTEMSVVGVGGVTNHLCPAIVVDFDCQSFVSDTVKVKSVLQKKNPSRFGRILAHQPYTMFCVFSFFSFSSCLTKSSCFKCAMAFTHSLKLFLITLIVLYGFDSFPVCRYSIYSGSINKNLGA